MRSTHKIKFENLTFHKGLNLTVRLGDKWHRRLSPGDHLRLVSVNEQEEFAGYPSQVLVTFLIEVGRIPDYWLQFEHDPKCRTSKGLFEGLFEVYGDSMRSEEELVTCVFFHLGPPPSHRRVGGEHD